jgi:antitoxin component YwqK of YwqJK toxin-antitoxin module
MNKQLALTFKILFLMTFYSCSTKSVNIESLILKNEVFYNSESQIPHTGGIFKLWENGNLSFEGNLINGKPNGIFKYFFKDHKNRVQKIVNYSNGLADGESTEYDTSNNIITSINYSKGEKNGKSFQSFNVWKIYEEYKNNMLVNELKYTYPKIDKVMAEGKYEKGVLKIESCKVFYPDGKIKQEFIKKDNNLYNQIEYHNNGAIKRTYNFNAREGYENINLSRGYQKYLNGYEYTDTRFEPLNLTIKDQKDYLENGKEGNSDPNFGVIKIITKE